MSYDYNALVTSLSSHRESATAAREASDTSKYVEHLQEALQVFETLSGHCPMTPLLWLQYAYDMHCMMTSQSTEEEAAETARQSRLQTMELALNEFPGSAVLQLHYCELLVESLPPEPEEDQLKTAQKALLKALSQVGSGSHRNEGEIIAQLYRLHAHFAITHQKGQDAALASLLQRARTPMENANDSLQQEVHSFCNETAKVPSKTLQEEFLPALEEARRWEAKAYSRLRSCEDDVSMAMLQEQIRCNDQVDLAPSDASTFSFVTTSNEFIDNVMKAKPEKNVRFWMGFGGAGTAKAFQQYAAACRKFRFPKDDNPEAKETDSKKQQQQLILAVFERAIAECPTVESLWLAYLKHITYLWNNDPEYAPPPQTFKTVSTRAVRNCPFSLALTQQQLLIPLLLANKDQSDYVLDPDELLQIVNKALDSKFLPSPANAFDLFVTAIRTIQRRMLFLLAKTVLGVDPSKKTKQATVLKYDEIELMASKTPKGNNAADTAAPLDGDSWQEVQDLCEEMKDMFEAATSRLSKDHKSWNEGRSMLLHEQGLMERVVIAPLLSLANTKGTMMAENDGGIGDALLHFEKATKSNPPHPDSYKALIEQVLHHGASSSGSSRNPGDVVSRLRQVRGLYQRAMKAVGKSKVKDAAAAMQMATSASSRRDYETALTCLCNDYREFERVFGSERSLADASRLIQKKLQKASFHATKRHKSAAPPQQGEAPMEVDEEEPSNTRLAKRRASDAANEAKDSRGENPRNKRRKMEAKQQNSSEAEISAAPQPNDSEEHNAPSKQRKKDAEEAKTDEPAPAPRKPNVQPKQNYKVKIGTIFHKAHPYTVRISNLALETEEMDIIEAFKQEHKCGAVVHCRVQREKVLHGKGKKGVSKGWGLLQFEERESVEKALGLDQKVELYGSTLHLARSHVPAVGIVPSGMHRPKQKETMQDSGQSGDSGKSSVADAAKSTIESKTGSAVGILAFRPRGVAKKQQGPKKGRPKTKLDLAPTESSAQSDKK